LKKILTLVLVAIMALAAFAGCGSTTPSASPTGTTAPKFDKTKDIAVVSREEGSGTRGAFIELFGVQEKDAAGKTVDKTTAEATISNSTSVVMTTVAGNPYAIGYISLGSLDNSVKAMKVDGADATVANIKSGTYKISRPFNIATKGTPNAVAQDFISFIMSKDGQKVVSDNKYIPLDNAPAFTSKKPSGKIVVGGSSSVTPLMEKLQEAYKAINPNATIEIQMSDSTTGMTNALSGVCDIGMASRELKESETSAGLTHTVIATDGIAVIVNKDNVVDNMTKDQVKQIYTGALTKWSDIAK